MSVSAPALSVAKVMAILQGLDRREVARDILCIAYRKRDAIELDYSTDTEKLQAAIKHWLLWNPLASWRELINQLYLSSKSAIADDILRYAEKPKGT